MIIIEPAVHDTPKRTKTRMSRTRSLTNISNIINCRDLFPEVKTRVPQTFISASSNASEVADSMVKYDCFGYPICDLQAESSLSPHRERGDKPWMHERCAQDEQPNLVIKIATNSSHRRSRRHRCSSAHQTKFRQTSCSSHSSRKTPSSPRVRRSRSLASGCVNSSMNELRDTRIPLADSSSPHCTNSTSMRGKGEKRNEPRRRKSLGGSLGGNSKMERYVSNDSKQFLSQQRRSSVRVSPFTCKNSAGCKFYKSHDNIATKRHSTQQRQQQGSDVALDVMLLEYQAAVRQKLAVSFPEYYANKPGSPASTSTCNNRRRSHSHQHQMTSVDQQELHQTSLMSDTCSFSRRNRNRRQSRHHSNENDPCSKSRRTPRRQVSRRSLHTTSIPVLKPL